MTLAKQGVGRLVRRRERNALGASSALASMLLLTGSGLAVAQVPAPAASPQVTAQTAGTTLRGTVVAGTAGKPGGVPLPGVAVTATNTLTGRKYTAATGVDGVYALTIPRAGRYVVRAEFAGFAPLTQEVVISATDVGTAKTSDFGLQLASRAAAVEQATAGAAATGTRTGSGRAGLGGATLGRGPQSLSLEGAAEPDLEVASQNAGDSTTGMPSLAGINGEAGDQAVDTLAVSGQTGTTNGLAGYSQDELRQRIQDGVAQAQASGMLPPGVDPTNAIAGILGGMMQGPGGFGGGQGGGGRGGRGGGAGGGGRGSGAFRNFNPTQLHGGFNYQGEYSPLDSAPWSPTLNPGTRTDYAINTFGGTLAGSPYIPGLIKPSTKQFAFLNFNVTRSQTPAVYVGIVPTDAMRGDTGDAVFPQTNAPTIYDPLTGDPFPGNIIPHSRISPQALAILQNYYPHENPALAGQSYNYQTATINGSNTSNVAFRFTRSLGSSANQGPFGRFGGGGGGGRGNGARRQNLPPVLRQSISANFAFSHTARDLKQLILPLSGSSSTQNFNLVAGYQIGYGRFNDNVSVTWNRSNSVTRNYFTDTTVNPNAIAGIALPDTSPSVSQPNFYSGLAGISINDFASLSNTAPTNTLGQTISVSDLVNWRHGRHNLRFGVDVRRVHQDQLGGNNPLGQFTFTGYNTESPQQQCATSSLSTTSATTPCTPSSSTTPPSGSASTGSSFADFLLGLPQQSELQAGLNKIYLRENVLDWYANDDWRARNGLTLNFGLRYEYFGPYSEKNSRLVNLTGVSTATTSVGCVTPLGTSFATINGASTVTCAQGPTSSLLHADKAMYSPRFGFAYRPSFFRKALKDTVLRGGYGINYNTSQYQSFARSLSYQAPFAATQNNTLTTAAHNTGCVQQTATGQNANLTLANGFTCSNSVFQNTFGVNPDYRLGMVQVYNLNIQRTIPMNIVLNFGYNGSHGSNLNVIRAPNHTLVTTTGGTASQVITTPNAVAFTYADSTAESTFNALTVGASKRLQKGVALGANYTYAHSIDDASTIGGGITTASVQNDADLHAERSNSSFDVRHTVTGTWVYEPPFGPNRAFLNKGGIAAKILDGFSISGTFTFASGGYFTPSYQATAAQTAGGGDFTQRPDRVFSQPIAGAGQLKNWFNTAAFATPVGYGTASRYSIEGPGQVLVSSSLSRTVPLSGTRSFEGRLTAANVFNTVQYNGIGTVLGGPQGFGTVTSAASMRTLTFVGRFRF